MKKSRTRVVVEIPGQSPWQCVATNQYMEYKMEDLSRDMAVKETLEQALRMINKSINGKLELYD